MVPRMCCRQSLKNVVMHAIASIAALLFCGISANASAQAYPTKPIRLVVGFAPGGAADTVARSVGEALGRELGQPIVIENRAGAGSSIAAENVARSAPDGYSLLIASPSSISVNPALNPKLNYRPQDLLPITKITAWPLSGYPNTAYRSGTDFSYPWVRRQTSSKGSSKPPLSPWANPRSRKCWRAKGPR